LWSDGSAYIRRLMHIEYVTDPVPWLRLRCPKCGMPVRQIREDLKPSHSVLLFLAGEPLAWLVIGTGLLIGFLGEAVAFLFFAWAILVPVGAAWLWLSRLRRASFLCRGCGHISNYAEARGPAHRQPS
jgi:hypothetical protein